LSASMPTQSYASNVTITRDPSGQPVGQVISGGRVITVTGPDIEKQIEQILGQEYDSMSQEMGSYWVAREAARKKARGVGGMAIGGMEAGIGAGAGLIGSANSHSQPQPHHHQAHSQPHVRGGGMTLSKAGKWVDLIHTAISLATGNYWDVAIGMLTNAIGDWYEGVESLWDKKQKPKLFTACFGGIVIMATSRRMLRKLLQRQRNKRIDRIMRHVREQTRNQDEASETDAYGRTKDNDKTRALRKKKKLAKMEMGWQLRICPQGQQTGWRGRSKDLRDRVKVKKERAEYLGKQRLELGN
jgi:hypothetical protein